jgi:hypothetical protein
MTMYGGTSRWGTPLANWRQLELAGTAPGVVTVPANRRLDCITVIAGTTPVTVDLLGLPTVTVPAGIALDWPFEGGETAPGGGLAITLGGGVSSYIVTYLEAP